MINNVDPDLKFIIENPFKSLTFLDIDLQIIENNLVFCIYPKPTNSFHYLTYTSYHPPHTKNNMPLSLAKRSVSIVTNNRQNWLKGIKRTFAWLKISTAYHRLHFYKNISAKIWNWKNDNIPNIILILKNSIAA